MTASYSSSRAVPVTSGFRQYPTPVRVEDVFLPDPATRRNNEAYASDPDFDEGVDPPDRHR